MLQASTPSLDDPASCPPSESKECPLCSIFLFAALVPCPAFYQLPVEGPRTSSPACTRLPMRDAARSH